MEDLRMGTAKPGDVMRTRGPMIIPRHLSVEEMKQKDCHLHATHVLPGDASDIEVEQAQQEAKASKTKHHLKNRSQKRRRTR